MKKIFFAVAAVGISSLIQAQNDTTLLDEVVLTASKFEQKQSQTGKVVTVIGKEQLEKSPGQTLGQLLNDQAGISIAGAYQAPGSVQTIFMRGASSGRTLILLNGIPVYDPSMINNEFDLHLISLHDVERIEICRGAQSTLYGSDAIAGVINIITVKKEVSRPFHLQATTVYGNKNSWRSSLQMYGKIKNRFMYSGHYAKMSTGGFSAALDSSGLQSFDRDGFDGETAAAAWQYQLFPSASWRAYVRHSRYHAGIDAGVFADDRDFTAQNENLIAGSSVQGKKGLVHFTGHIQLGRQKRKYLNDSLHAPGFVKFASDEYHARTLFAEGIGYINLNTWFTILTGIDYRRAVMNQQYFSVSSFGPYSSRFDDKSLSHLSVYSSVFLRTADKKLNFEAGGRINKHSRYGVNGTFTLNPSFELNKQWRVFGSIASGFKAPSIFQVYDAFSGNEELQAEKSVNYEMGLQQVHKKISSRVVWFRRHITNGIDFNYVSFRYFNFVKQVVNGLELEWMAKPLNQLQLSGNYTFLAGEEHTQSRKNFSDTVYQYLLRRPQHHLNVSAGLQCNASLYVSVRGKWVSRRFDVGGFMTDDVQMKGYFILSAYTEYRYGAHTKFFAELQNITNRKFTDIRGYNAIPFLIYGGITISL